MRKSLVMLTATVCLLAACSSISVNSDWDRDADFASYTSYAWMPQPTAASAPANATQARASNDLVDKRIRHAIDTQMRAKGFEQNDATPTILVVYHVGLTDKINVTDYGYRYSYDYWGWGGRDIDVYQYTEGTLIIDMIDAATQELVWRGSATGTVDEQASPDKMETNINNAVAQVFGQYPPRQN